MPTNLKSVHQHQCVDGCGRLDIGFTLGPDVLCMYHLCQRLPRCWVLPFLCVFFSTRWWAVAPQGIFILSPTGNWSTKGCASAHVTSATNTLDNLIHLVLSKKLMVSVVHSGHHGFPARVWVYKTIASEGRMRTMI